MERIYTLACEGPPGVGKTDLCYMLASKLNYQVVEDTPLDPFPLRPYFPPSKKNALSTQLYFLLTRVKIIKQYAPPSLFRNLILDFTLLKEKIYASLFLSETENKIYEELLQQLTSGLPLPDAVILLMASPDYLYDHIKRKYGYDTDADYLCSIVNRYRDFPEYYTEGGILVVDVEHIEVASQLNRLLELLPQTGVRYYTAGEGLF